MNDIAVFWELFGKFAVVLGVIVGALKGVEYLTNISPLKALQRRIYKNEEDIKELKKRVETVEEEATRRNDEADEVVESINMLGLGLVSVLSHLIDGNGKDEMKKERDELNRFFYKERSK